MNEQTAECSTRLALYTSPHLMSALEITSSTHHTLVSALDITSSTHRKLGHTSHSHRQVSPGFPVNKFPFSHVTNNNTRPPVSFYTKGLLSKKATAYLIWNVERSTVHPSWQLHSRFLVSCNFVTAYLQVVKTTIFKEITKRHYITEYKAHRAAIIQTRMRDRGFVLIFTHEWSHVMMKIVVITGTCCGTDIFLTRNK